MKKYRKLRAGETVFVVLMLAFSLFVLIMSYRISGFASISSPGAFPMAAAAVMLVSVGMVLISHRKLEKPDTKNLKEELRVVAKTVFPKNVIIYLGIIIGYMLIIEPIHFLASSFIFMVLSMFVLHGGGFAKSLIISAGTLASIFAIFQFFFRVVLP
jgi:putative tricarboxylic transport membrane protein